MDSIDWPSGNPDTINYKSLDIHLAKYQVCNQFFSKCIKGKPWQSVTITRLWQSTEIHIMFTCVPSDFPDFLVATVIILTACFCFSPEPQRSRCNDQSSGRAGWDKDHFGKLSPWAQICEPSDQSIRVVNSSKLRWTQSSCLMISIWIIVAKIICRPVYY